MCEQMCSPKVPPFVEGPSPAPPSQGNQVKPFGLGMWLEGLQQRNVPGQGGGAWRQDACRRWTQEGGPEVSQVKVLPQMPTHPHQPHKRGWLRPRELPPQSLPLPPSP